MSHLTQLLLECHLTKTSPRKHQMNEWNGALSKPIPTEPGESHEDTNLKKYYSLEGDIYITTQKKNQLFHKMFSVVLTTPSPGIKAKYREHLMKKLVLFLCRY